MIRTKKAQMILFSILMALFIFLLVLSFFFDSLITKPIMQKDNTKILEREATRLSDSVLLPGYPENWHENGITTRKIGLSTDGKLDENKINNLSVLANQNYATTKTLLGIQTDYFINITYTNSSGTQQILVNNTPITQALNHNYVITRERITLINQENKKIPAKIVVATYSN